MWDVLGRDAEAAESRMRFLSGAEENILFNPSAPTVTVSRFINPAATRHPVCRPPLAPRQPPYPPPNPHILDTWHPSVQLQRDTQLERSLPEARWKRWLSLKRQSCRGAVAGVAAQSSPEFPTVSTTATTRVCKGWKTPWRKPLERCSSPRKQKQWECFQFELHFSPDFRFEFFVALWFSQFAERFFFFLGWVRVKTKMWYV